MIRFACPKCGKVYKAAAELAGKESICKECNVIVVIPERPVREVLYGTALPPKGVADVESEPDEPPVRGDKPPPDSTRPREEWPDRKKYCHECGERIRVRAVSAGRDGTAVAEGGGVGGLDKAEAWVALSDGGSGLEDFLRTNFRRVEAVILDFYHASEYLAKLAKALHPTDEAAALERTKGWSRMLRDEGGHAMIAVLEGWDWPAVRGLAAV